MHEPARGNSAPMKKEVSCTNILTCESYLRRTLPDVPLDRLFSGIVGSEAFLITDEDCGTLTPVPESYLLSPDNWVSAALETRVYENLVSLLNDPNAVYKAGAEIFRTPVGRRLVHMRLAPVKAVIERLPREDAKFSRVRDVEVVQNDEGYAVVRLRWHPDAAVSKMTCDMNRGVYEGLGRLRKNPSSVEERVCRFNGGDYCEYHIRWKPRPLFLRLVDLFRFWHSREIIDELERRIEEVDDIRIRQEKLIAIRTRDLEREKEKVDNAQRALSRYVAPQLAKKLLEGGGESLWKHQRRKLTLFFSDIKDFTPLTDGLEPEDLAGLLNEYFSSMFDIVHRHGGTLAHMIGDGLFIFFGAPEYTNDRDHADRCVRMAVDMQLTMRDLRDRWFNEGIDMPLEIRCGVNTGMATVGSYGSRERREYTAMGMQVNLAARLESACTPGGILVSHSTWALTKDAFEFEEKGLLDIKGLQRPFRTYRVIF